MGEGWGESELVTLMAVVVVMVAWMLTQGW